MLFTNHNLSSDKFDCILNKLTLIPSLSIN